MDNDATTPRLTATPIYPGTTETFPYVFVIREEDEDFFTAYGLRLLDGPHAPDCDFCDKSPVDAFVEHGAYGSPGLGVPVHVKCVLERGGVIARTQDVSLEPPPGSEPRPCPTLEELNAALPPGCTADWAHTPSVFSIALPGLPDYEATVYLTQAFNREDGGWEAVLDKDGDQQSLLDGPLPTAHHDAVLGWACAVVLEALVKL